LVGIIYVFQYSYFNMDSNNLSLNNVKLTAAHNNGTSEWPVMTESVNSGWKFVLFLQFKFTHSGEIFSKVCKSSLPVDTGIVIKRNLQTLDCNFRRVVITPIQTRLPKKLNIRIRPNAKKSPFGTSLVRTPPHRSLVSAVY